VPDFDAIPAHMDVLAAAKPFVVAQNMETVKRLTHKVRDIRAGYEKTLQCLDYYKQQHGMRTKTSLMVGLGETMEEIEECMDDLRAVGWISSPLASICNRPKNTLEWKILYSGGVQDYSAGWPIKKVSSLWRRARWSAPATRRRTFWNT
jgi:hypothetical protein